MRHACCVLFLWYEDNEATARNLASFRKNAGCHVIVVKVYTSDDPAIRKNLIFNADFNLYNHLIPHGASERWFVAEWDTYCNMPVAEYCKHVWDLPLSASSVKWPNRDQWDRWAGVKLPEKVKPFLCGVAPLSTMMISDECLRAVTKIVHDEPWDVFCEIRLPTAAHYAGFCPAANPLAGALQTWQPLSQDQIQNRRGIFHPVKHVVP